MLVFTEVSSMKTSFDGVSFDCCSRHSTRALATSLRACSAAWRDFFDRQTSAASVLFIRPVLAEILCVSSSQARNSAIVASGRLATCASIAAYRPPSLGATWQHCGRAVGLARHPASRQNLRNVGY